MAYMNQTRKREIETQVKQILQKYNVKGRLSVKHHSTLMLTITSGDIDFTADFIATDRYDDFKPLTFDPAGHQVNLYHIDTYFNNVAKDFLHEIKSAMNTGNYDNSQIEFDYFEVGWYSAVHIGKWDKPYTCNKSAI